MSNNPLSYRRFERFHSYVYQSGPHPNFPKFGFQAGLRFPNGIDVSVIFIDMNTQFRHMELEIFGTSTPLPMDLNVWEALSNDPSTEGYPVSFQSLTEMEEELDRLLHLPNLVTIQKETSLWARIKGKVGAVVGRLMRPQ